MQLNISNILDDFLLNPHYCLHMVLCGHGDGSCVMGHFEFNEPYLHALPNDYFKPLPYGTSVKTSFISF